MIDQRNLLAISWAIPLTVALVVPGFAQTARHDQPSVREIQSHFRQGVAPLLDQFCVRCHDVDTLEAGVRVDGLDGTVPDEAVELWKRVDEQVASGSMPPQDEPRPSDEQRRRLRAWIEEAIHMAKSRIRPKNGIARRLTVAQYRNTLQELLGIDDDLTELLPPDAISRDGFRNNSGSMVLSPILVEAYFSIAEHMLDRCLVDEQSVPEIQNFRVDLGESINPDPCPDKLILGANSELLNNEDFVVSELTPAKAFDFDQRKMRTRFRFHEGYQGNATVRGWREYDSIYHAVFACVRGNRGYPKGKAYETVPSGLLLRPAIPSAEIFKVQSTYGPRANFKISLRELPRHGKFRVTVRAARYDDALLLDAGDAVADAGDIEPIIATLNDGQTKLEVDEPGVYRVDVRLGHENAADVEADASRLDKGRIGHWSFNGDLRRESDAEESQGRLVGNANYVDSPFGKAISFAGAGAAAVVPRNASMNVGSGDFTVAAWIRPRKLQQGGIVCLGKYSWTHGWYLDMPNGRGVLRIETANPDNMPNGTVASPAGVIRAGRWQHVAAVVRRGEKKTRLYVNGFQVASGTIAAADLDNPKVDLVFGRIQDGKLFDGEIDEPRIYRRALSVAEINAIVQPGRQFVQPPAAEKPQNLTLRLGDRKFSGTLHQPAFLVVRLARGTLPASAQYDGTLQPVRLVISRLPESDPLGLRFRKFEAIAPSLGVHVGLRRDCGSTLAPVGSPVRVTSNDVQDYVFEGAIDNFPSPEVQNENDNYLAGIHEIGVRCEYTDGRDLPRLLIDSVEFEGPYYDSWPPASHRRILMKSTDKHSPQSYAREVLSRFAFRAFRRLISERELETLMATWEDAYKSSGELQSSLKQALIVVLSSPQFLFLIERSTSPEPEALDPYELASKLSYFLWNGPPDEGLLAAAKAGTLHESIDEQVMRMIADQRFARFSNAFVRQWLDLDRFDIVDFDRDQYAKLTRDVRTQLRQEPVRFVEHLIRENLSVTHLVRSNLVMVNEVVADYYDLGGRVQSGFEFVAVDHRSDHLGGLLSQAGIMAGLSDGRHAHPIKRGAWLARKIVAEPPDDPPPNVPRLPEEDDSRLTLRERLEKHRDAPGCANCHAGIDPWGIPLEQIDAAGKFRSTPPDELSAELPDGTPIMGVAELKGYLADRRAAQVAFSFVKHLATYAVGRSLTYNESEQLLSAMQRRGDKNDLGMQDLLRYVIDSAAFMEK